MARDDIYDAMKAISKEKFDADRARFLIEANQADDGGWTKHTPFHWSRQLKGKRLDYWPSRKRYRYQNKTRRGNVYALIRKLDGTVVLR